MVFRYFPLFIILISLWLFLRTIKFCFANFLFLVPFLSLLCFLASAFPFPWGWPQPACWVSVTGPETPATLPMVFVTLTLRTPYRISLVLPIACCSFCAPFVCLPPFYPMIRSVVICALLEGFPLPLSGFPLSNHRRFQLRQLADRPLSSNWGILLECRLPSQFYLKPFFHYVLYHTAQLKGHKVECHLCWGISSFPYSVFIWTLQLLSSKDMSFPTDFY